MNKLIAKIIVMLMLVFGALSAIPTAEAEAKNNEHLDADSSVPEMNLGTMIFENPLWYMAGGVLMVSKDNKNQRKPRRARTKPAPKQNKTAGINQKGTQKWAAEELGIETPKDFMSRVVKLCAHEEQGNFLDVLKNELKEQYDKLDNRINDQAMRLDYLLQAILSYPEVLKKNKKHVKKNSMLHISFNHNKLFTLLKDLRDELDLGPYKLHLTKEKYIPNLIQREYTTAAKIIAKKQVKTTCNYEEYNSNFIDDRWEKFHEDFRVWSEELVDNKFNERNMPVKSDYFGVQIVDMMKYIGVGDESTKKTVEKDLRTQYNKNADKSTTLLDKESWTNMKVKQALTEILAQKLRRFKILMTKNSQEYLVWHCTSMPEKMVVSKNNGETMLKSRSDWNGLRCYFGPTNGVRNTPFWNVKQEGKAPYYSGDVLSYCKMRGLNSFSKDDNFSKKGVHLHTWMNVMLNGTTSLKARLAGLYIIAAVLKSKGKDITKLESKPLGSVKNVNRLKKAPRKKFNKNNKKNQTDVKQAEKLAELKDAVHSADEYDVEKYKTTKVDSNTIEDAIGGLGNIDIVDNGPLWPDTTTVKELRERCKEIPIKGYSSMKKTELLALVRNHDEPKPTKRNRKKGSKSKTPKFD